MLALIVLSTLTSTLSIPQTPRTAETLFPDYECRNLPLFDSFRKKLIAADSIKTMMHIEEFNTLISPPMTLDYLENIYTTCPYGGLTLELLLALRALMNNEVNGYEQFLTIFQHHLSQNSFMYLMGTEWPILALINNELFVNLPMGDVDVRITCPHDRVIDWTAFKRLMRSGEDWFIPSFKYIFDAKLGDGAMHECPVGFALVHAIKSMICANTESICFRYHVTYVDRVLSSIPIDILAASDWKLIQFLVHVREKVVRHRFQLDFTPQELTGETVTVGSDFERVLKNIDISLDSHMVPMTMVYGSKFVSRLERFLKRAKAVGINQLVVFCLDDEACRICKESPYAAFCIRGTPSILNKFTLPQMFLNAGLDVFWLDFDVFLFKNPLPYVRAHAGKAVDVLTASSFAADCVCSGLVYLRATEGVRKWWLQATGWMYRHTFEHDQKTVSAFLNAGERVASPADLPDIEIPPFEYLEASQLFVSARHVEVGGWTGDADDIVIYHFLNGDSDEKSSIKNDESIDIYDDLIEAFYGDSAPDVLFQRGDALPHRESAELNRLILKSRWSERPVDRPICTGVVPVQSSSNTDM